MGRVFHVMKKEFIQTFRDRRMVAIIFIAPLIQLFLFGYAVTTDVKDIRVGIYDLDISPESRRVVEALTGSGYFTLAGSLNSPDQIRESLFAGQIDMALVFGHDFSSRLHRGEQADVQVLFDATDSNFAIVGSGYLGRILFSLSQDLLEEQMGSIRALAALMDRNIPGSLPMVQPKMRVWYNPELKSALFMVPGVICMLLMVVTMILSALAVTREREIGTIEQVIVSPIASWELILGKLAPFAILGFIDVGLIVAVGTWHFGVPFRGSVALLFAASGLFLFTTLGLGLFFSTISKNQQQAMFTVFMFMMPAILLSGFMFPIANMPDVIQWLTYLNPLRYFLVIIRGIFLKGTGFDILWPQMAALAVFGLAIFGAASARFTKRLA